ncbi:isocitrate lyase/PEP mutase family protein [Deinococcus cellulosilyticus]|uniref:Uncharacterized protein n=1 Tax=Deinococcus cellulosilyticus (strain DSM 18568 / NBRC 106333 / KACC 11606 / 5516J-15) TaxID=1223518 RepID=A0A511N323_DEIC1|nr:isocitrate lyase/phosphoenolpyruvate mutase family protein [Deinococcus cellulosilyticus]GEM46858.1 hypothetical protein DC3_24930 [Deinococcus cellulosilyticus NBRC 106333 = KACC 11606]
MTIDQHSKAQVFKALHEKDGTFVIPNPWDAGTARLLTSLGFPALATTSAGLAWSLGMPDGAGAFSRDQAIENVRQIAQATPLPVSADFENGYGHTPEEVAEGIRKVALEGGAVGASIEDATSVSGSAPIYDFQLAVERIHAAVEAARTLPFPFVLVARAENFCHGITDMEDTLRRLKAYEAAGADVLFAPGIKTLDQVREVCQAVQKPVNVNAGIMNAPWTVAELSEAGVKRISLGAGLVRVALASFVQAAQELQKAGSFSFMKDAGKVNLTDLMFKEHIPR